jgi:methylthioribose-1-phosphate isomerase
MIAVISPVERGAHGVRLIDQRKLPLDEIWIECRTPEAVADAIRQMVVRGAPAIGIAAAWGLALGATQAQDLPAEAFEARIAAIGNLLAGARPTAVNLGWAVRRMGDTARAARARGADPRAVAAALEAEAQSIRDEDLAACRSIGAHGAGLVPQRGTVLTHCNAGALATAGYGTALGIVRRAVEDGKRIRVLADETRPFFQGARLTAWELMRDGIETVLIADSSAGGMMRAGEVDLVIVGADRIARNGDVANKVGTYNVAVLARQHNLPFYVAAPLSTIDLDCSDGSQIPIEERDPREVTEPFGVRVAPPGVQVRNPAFDVTPAELVTAIVTEAGVARAPYDASLRALFR